MKSYKHSGKIGDILWSLPFIESSGGGLLYLNLNSEFQQKDYDYLYTLLVSQPFIHGVKVYDGQPVDFDLDKFRDVNLPGINLAERYFHAFNTEYDKIMLHLEPTLVPPKPYGPDNYVLVTKGQSMPSREFFNPAIANIVERNLKKIGVFVGLPSEHQTFCNIYNCKIPFVKVRDAMDMADWVNNASLVIGNQTSTTVMAELLKKTLVLEVRVDAGAPDHKFNRPNLFYI
jgi:hypothetical protein